MTSRDVTPEQRRARMNVMGRQLRYMNRICARAQRLRWPLDDPLVQNARGARVALQKVFEVVATGGMRVVEEPRYPD